MKWWVIFFFIAFIAGPASAGDDKERYIRENRLLEEELKLARRHDIYLALNLKEKTASIKLRGIQLKKLQINEFHYWGNPISEKAYRLRKKSAFIDPGREMMTPGENREKENFTLDALELADMPSRFTMILDSGLTISVRPVTDGIFLEIGNFFSSSIRFSESLMAILWNILRGKPYTAIDVVLDKNSARSLYWSLAEGSSVIIYPP